LVGNLAPHWDDRGTFERRLSTLGFIPRGSISGKTRILVAGDTPGPSKAKKAVQQEIQIMGEEEFLHYIDISIDT